ncbi:VapE domain-containing protein [Oenococcus alcoholitolerans]|uniref:VapE domain-containing protein n=1 Tax=Oenococcus alcoholitolerans TaxID=931074 RepID=UPI003F6FDDBC
MNELETQLKALNTSPINDGFHRNANNQLISDDITNAYLILTAMLKPLGDELLRYNLLSHKIDITQTFKIGSFNIKKGNINDDFIDAFRFYASQHFRYQIKPDIADNATKAYAHNYSYHPLQNFLDDAYLNWDGENRIDTFLNKYLGIDQNDFNIRMFKVWLVEAVVKAFKPDAKADYVLLIKGSQQGIGKTTLLKKLAVSKDWYTDSITSFSDKDSIQAMVGRWIVNDDEMVASKATSISATKKFITQEFIEYRAPYGHYLRRHDKGFVIALTTNEPTPIKDKTGARRYLIFNTNKDQRKADITKTNPQELQEEIKQLWGEAVTLYKNRYSIVLNDLETQQLTQLQEGFIATDSIEENLNDIAEEVKTGEHFSLRQLVSMVLAKINEDNQRIILNGKKERQIRNEIAMIMEKRTDWKRTNTHNLQGYTKI